MKDFSTNTNTMGKVESFQDFILNRKDNNDIVTFL